MNKDNVRKLIEGVRDATVFNMIMHETCFCGVGRQVSGGTDEWWGSQDLWKWLGMAENEPKRQRMCMMVGVPIMLNDATREQAIDMLERFLATGRVEWRA